MEDHKQLLDKDALNAAVRELNDLIDKGELTDRFGSVHGELFLEFYARHLHRSTAADQDAGGQRLSAA